MRKELCSPTSSWYKLFLSSLLISCSLFALLYIFLEPRIFMLGVKAKLSDEGFASPPAINRFKHIPHLLDASFRQIVLPNTDTLYSIAWLDLRDEPVVLHVPETGGRYYLLQALDTWTNVFASIGRRTTGTTSGDFVFASPQWKGNLPKGVSLVRATTDEAWIIGRTLVSGPADTAGGVEIMKQYTLTKLSQFVRPQQLD